MILFEEDWEKYPTAEPDLSPENQEWIDIAYLFKEMGIKNHLFFLALHDQSLKGVDPYSPDNTTEVNERIVQECKVNFWYFLRNQRAPSQSGSGVTKFIPNRQNIAMFWLYFTHITAYIVAPRQVGKSFSLWVLGMYLVGVRLESSRVNLITKNDKLKVESITDMKRILDTYPPCLRLRGKDDKDNSEEITINALSNTFSTHLSSANPILADNVCRGSTSATLFGDEIPSIPKLGRALAAATKSSLAARRFASAANEPWGTIFVTTAGEANTESGSHALGMWGDSCPWTEILYDSKDEEDLKKTVVNNSRKRLPRVACEFNHLQLGFGPEWFKTAVENSEGSTKEEIERDLLNIWITGGDGHPLESAVVDVIVKSFVEPAHTEITGDDNYIVKWYITEDRISEYLKTNSTIMSLDASDAGGGDDIGMVLRSVIDGTVIAVGAYNLTNIITFCKFIYNTFILDYPKLLTIVESKSQGVTIMDDLVLRMLSDEINPFKRLWNRVVSNPDGDNKNFELVKSARSDQLPALCTKFKKFFGFPTGGGSGLTSRKSLYSDILLGASKYTGSVVRDKELIAQIKGLIKKNGRVDHPAGLHDDLVIAWLLSYFVIYKAINLEYYGIDVHAIMKNAMTADKVGLSRKQIVKKQHQKILRNKIDNLYKEYNLAKNTVRKSMIESQIIALSEKLTDVKDQDTIYSRDAVRAELDKHKKQSNLIRMKNRFKR